MKTALIAVVLGSLLLSACAFPRPLVSGETATPATAIPSAAAPVTATASSGSDIFDTPWEDRSVYQPGLVASQEAVLAELGGASVYHIELSIAGDLYHVTGKQEVRYTNAETGSLREVRLRLFPNLLGGEMSVSNLRVDGQAVSPGTGLENSLLIVPLPQALDPGESVVLQMDFAVTVPQAVERNYGVLAYADQVLALAHAYPMIAVYNDEGWNAEVPPQSGDVAFADASFFLVRITAPKGVDVVTSGRQISRVDNGEVQTVSIASGPARDFYLAASADYQEISQTFGDVTVRSYAPPSLEQGARMALETAGRALATFGKRYSPFPYTELDIVATPTLALGIEYPGMIAITSRIYDVDGDYRGAPASIYMESTVAHEVGHQWFYNQIGSDQLDDPWLDESLTQFVTLQYYADNYGRAGEQGFRSSLEGRWESIGRAALPIGLPVAAYSGREYSGIVYGRGPLFFIALRKRMGTERFDAFLKEYVRTFSWDIASPEQLQSLAETQCACDLDALFDEWVYP